MCTYIYSILITGSGGSTVVIILLYLIEAWGRGHCTIKGKLSSSDTQFLKKCISQRNAIQT